MCINSKPHVDVLHERFLSILPKIETHARICFRNVKCPGKKSDRIAECVGLAWRWFCRLAERGKDATRFPMVLADFAARHVNAGRRLTGQEKPNDVLSPRAQQMRGFVVDKLPDFSTLTWNPYMEALHDSTRTSPPEAAAFRIDWPSFLTTRTERDRHMIADMARGETTKKLSLKYKLSPGRVSQLRRDFHDGWNRHCGELLPRKM